MQYICLELEGLLKQIIAKYFRHLYISSLHNNIISYSIKSLNKLEIAVVHSNFLVSTSSNLARTHVYQVLSMLTVI